MLRITSKSGHGRDTKFIDTASGRDLNDVVAILLGPTVTFGDLVTASLTVVMVECEIDVAKAEWRTKHPVSGQYGRVRAITFHDGAGVQFAEGGGVTVIPGPPRS